MPPVCLDTPICLDALHMFGCPHMFGHPHMFGCLLYVLMMFGCPLYIHNTKKACFVRLRGCPYAPIHLDAPICLDAPCMFGWPPYVWTSPHMFGCPLYVWISPICLDTPIGLDTLLYVWMPAVNIQHKESMLCQTKGVSICPHTFVCPHMFGCSLYAWIPPCLETPTVCLDAHLYVWMPSIPYAWMPLVCFDAPICLDTTHSLDVPLYL